MHVRRTSSATFKGITPMVVGAAPRRSRRGRIRRHAGTSRGVPNTGQGSGGHSCACATVRRGVLLAIPRLGWASGTGASAAARTLASMRAWDQRAHWPFPARIRRGGTSSLSAHPTAMQRLDGPLSPGGTAGGTRPTAPLSPTSSVTGSGWMGFPRARICASSYSGCPSGIVATAR